MLSKLELELESAKVTSIHPGSGLADLDGKDAEIVRLSAELTALDTDRDRLAEEVAKLEGAVSGKEARIVALEDDLDAATQPEAVVQADLTAHVEPAAAIAESAADLSKEEGLARIAEIAARTAEGGPPIDDDLKEVHGIGPKIEKMLKDLGITSFRQIANFQGEDIAHVTAALDGFKGRIERDDWMGGAADEHAKKYGKPT
jgi:predicted flap endonuclease-1-like 5' DNA nuclease